MKPLRATHFTLHLGHNAAFRMRSVPKADSAAKSDTLRLDIHFGQNKGHTELCSMVLTEEKAKEPLAQRVRCLCVRSEGYLSWRNFSHSPTKYSLENIPCRTAFQVSVVWTKAEG